MGVSSAPIEVRRHPHREGLGPVFIRMFLGIPARQIAHKPLTKWFGTGPLETFESPSPHIRRFDSLPSAKAFSQKASLPATHPSHFGRCLEWHLDFPKAV